MSTVLVCDDDSDILHAMEISLKARGHTVYTAVSGTQALAAAAQRAPDAVVLDLALPDMNGIEVVYAIRGWSKVPIIILCTRHAGSQKVRALDAGANDCLTKPFGTDELIARLQVTLETPPPPERMARVETPDFVIDLASRRVTRDGRDVRLTTTEWRIIELLARNPGRLITHRQMLDEVWGVHDTRSNYIRVFLVALRRKLESDPAHPCYILTEHGVGTRLVLGDC